MNDLFPIQLRYGEGRKFCGEVLGKRLLLYHRAAPNVSSSLQEIRASLANPIEFPGLRMSFVPGDRIIVVLEPDTPDADVVVAEIWGVLARSGVSPDDVMILEAATWNSFAAGDPKRLLPNEVRDRITVKRHDPTEKGACAYLASTAAGDRIYLAREVVDADMVICVGPAQFDAVLGYRGTFSGLYPGLSDINSIRKAVGQGHDELGPDDPRPLRQIVDEVGWLLGAQFVINVVPGVAGGVQNVFAGQAEAVMRSIRIALQENWRADVTERAELVLVAVDRDAAGHGWEHVASAIDTARRLVEKDGRIVVLTELDAPLSPGLKILEQSRTPRDAIQPIRKAVPPDLIAATRMARAVDWANVYLLSRLEANLVEDLFMIPLETEKEVSRLLCGDETTVILEGGQYTYARCHA